MSAGTRRAEGRARMLPTGIEALGIVFDLVLLVVLTWLGLDMLGITAPSAILANATIIAFVAAGVLTVASLVVENVKEARTGTHSANRRDDLAPEVTRDVLSEALAAIEESENQFREQHPEVFLAPPADTGYDDFDDPDTEFADLPDFARPVAPPTGPPAMPGAHAARTPQPVP